MKDLTGQIRLRHICPRSFAHQKAPQLWGFSFISWVVYASSGQFKPLPVDGAGDRTSFELGLLVLANITTSRIWIIHRRGKPSQDTTIILGCKAPTEKWHLCRERERWTPFFGQVGGVAKVDSGGFVMPPYGHDTPQPASCRPEPSEVDLPPFIGPLPVTELG